MIPISAIEHHQILATSASSEWSAFELICDIIRFDASAERDGERLRTAINRVGWEAFLQAADQFRLGSLVADAIDRLRLTPPVPPVTLANGRMTVSQALLRRRADHEGQRRAFERQLDTIARFLNDRGIVPIVLKGGRSIATGENPWRSLRDLDLLVGRSESQLAQSILLAAGYAESQTPRPRRFHHHLRELYKDDLPGWIEIHHRGGSSRVEQFLPTARLLAAATPIKLDSGASVAVLTRPVQVLNGIVHHHIGHRAVKRGFIHPKGLYEFAAELSALDEAERIELAGLVARHPRILAIFDLWCAAARDLFGAAIPDSFAIESDAEQWWRGIREALERRGPNAEIDQGIGAELRAATRTSRMKRCGGGGNSLRRVYWRVTTPLSFSKRPSLFDLWNAAP